MNSRKGGIAHFRADPRWRRATSAAERVVELFLPSNERRRLELQERNMSFRLGFSATMLQGGVP